MLEAQARVGRLEAALSEAVEAWHFGVLVRNLQALRGIRLIVAATLVAEVGDLTRFENPKQLMAYVSLVPSEHSSGARTQRGRITRAVMDTPEPRWSKRDGRIASCTRRTPLS